MKKYRIAVGGLHIESSTFTNYISSYNDFVLKSGIDLINKYPWVDKFNEKVELIPILHGRALPGGRVSREFFDTWFFDFKNILMEKLREIKIEGFLFDIHGAMSVEGLDDAEGFMANEIREIIGDKVIVSATMDLHGNVSDLLFDSCDLLTCYRTAPHIDVEETKIRALTNLIFVLDNKCDIYKTKIDIPMLLPGEKTSTEVEPGKGIYKSIEAVINRYSLLDLSIWMGFPWADEERCHAAIISIGTDKSKVDESAKKIALDLWDNSNEFKFVGPVGTLEEALEKALESNKKPFFISDTGDNPGAGGSGDTNIVLREIKKINNNKKIEKNILIASIVDAQTIYEIYNSEFNELNILLGAKIDSKFGDPIKLKVKIINRFIDPVGKKSALVKFDNISIIITEMRTQYGDLNKFKLAGICSFNDYDIFIVKIGYLEPDLSKAAKGWIMALTDGAVCQDINKLKFYNLKRPIFPLDKEISTDNIIRKSNLKSYK